MDTARLCVFPFLSAVRASQLTRLTPFLADAYSVEILPFSIRAKGMTLMTTIQNLSLVFNQWVRRNDRTPTRRSRCSRSSRSCRSTRLPWKRSAGSTTSSTLEPVSHTISRKLCASLTRPLRSSSRLLSSYLLPVSFYLVMAFLVFRETKGLTAEEVGLLFDHDDSVAVEHLAEGKHEVGHIEKVESDSA